MKLIIELSQLIVYRPSNLEDIEVSQTTYIDVAINKNVNGKIKI